MDFTYNMHGGMSCRYGFSLPICIKHLCQTVFPQHPSLEQVTFARVDKKAMHAAKKQVDKVDDSQYEVVIDGGGGWKNLKIYRV